MLIMDKNNWFRGGGGSRLLTLSPWNYNTDAEECQRRLHLKSIEALMSYVVRWLVLIHPQNVCLSGSFEAKKQNNVHRRQILDVCLVFKYSYGVISQGIALINSTVQAGVVSFSRVCSTSFHCNTSTHTDFVRTAATVKSASA